MSQALLSARFLAALVHDIRGPLSVCAGAAGELGHIARQRSSDGDELKLIAAVATATDKLSRLVERLALVSTLPPDRSNTAVFDVRPFLAQAAGRVKDSREGVVTCADESVVPLKVAMSPTAFSEAVEQLLSNAVRHARSAVTLSAARSKGWVDIRVSDDGSGFDRQAREEFDEKTLTEPKPGRMKVRLGLFIAREIAHAFGGEIVLEEGLQGTCDVVLKLPAAPEVAAKGEV